MSPGQTGRTPGGVPPKFFMFIGFFFSPQSRDRCSNTPIALCFLWYRRLSLLHLLSVRIVSIALQRQALEGGLSLKKLASEAYCAIGGTSHEIASPIALQCDTKPLREATL